MATKSKQMFDYNYYSSQSGPCKRKDPDFGSLTPARILASRVANSKRPTQKNLRKHCVAMKSFESHG